MFENDDRQTTDAGVTGILIAHLGAFGLGELKREHMGRVLYSRPRGRRFEIHLRYSAVVLQQDTFILLSIVQRRKTYSCLTERC